jgi:hypothetical protein
MVNQYTHILHWSVVTEFTHSHRAREICYKRHDMLNFTQIIPPSRRVSNSSYTHVRYHEIKLRKGEGRSWGLQLCTLKLERKEYLLRCRWRRGFHVHSRWATSETHTLHMHKYDTGVKKGRKRTHTRSEGYNFRGFLVFVNTKSQWITPSVLKYKMF